MKRKQTGKRGWMTLEHAKFLMGLVIEGKGHWKAISTHIDTKTSKQVQSHAQKYFLRQKQPPSTKKKTSIHDFDYIKLEELFNGDYLRRLKETDPSTYHLYYRYRKAKQLLYDLDDRTKFGLGGCNRNGRSGFNTNYQGSGWNNPQMSRVNQFNQQYREKLKNVPILDPKGRELISRDISPTNDRGNIMTNQYRNQNSMRMNVNNGHNSFIPSPPLHYVQYHPNEDFQPINPESEYFMSLQIEEERRKRMEPQRRMAENFQTQQRPSMTSNSNNTKWKNFEPKERSRRNERMEDEQ